MKLPVARLIQRNTIALLLFAVTLLGVIGLSNLTAPGVSVPRAIAATPISNDPFQLYQQGELEKARQLWQATADAAAQRGDRVTELRNRINEAQALKALGAYPRALTLLTAALAQLGAAPPDPLTTTEQATTNTALLQLKPKLLQSLGEVYQATGKLDQANRVLRQSLEIAEQSGSQEDESAAYFSLGMVARSAIVQNAPRLLPSVVGRGKDRGDQLKVALSLLDGRPLLSRDGVAQPITPNLADVVSNFRQATQGASDSTLAGKAELNQLSLLADLLPRASRYLTSTLATSPELIDGNAGYFLVEYLTHPSLAKPLRSLAQVISTVRQLEDKPEQRSPAIEDLAQVQRQVAALTTSLVQGVSLMSDRLAQLPANLKTANMQIHHAQTLLRLKQVAVESDRVDEQLRQHLRTILVQVQQAYATPGFAKKLPQRSTIDPVFKTLTQELRQPRRSLFLPAQTRSILQQQVQQSLQQATQILIPTIATANQLQNIRLEASARVLLAEVYSLFAESSQDSRSWAQVETLSQQALQLVQAQDAPDLVLRAQQQYARSLIKQAKTPAARSACRVAATTLEANRSNLVSVDQDVQYSFLESVDPFYRDCVTVLVPQPTETPRQEDLKDARKLIEALQLAELDNFFQEACIEARKGQIDTLVDEQKSTKTAVIYPILLSNRRVGVIAKFPQVQNLQYRSTTAGENVEALLSRLKTQLTNINTSDSDDTKAVARTVYSWLIAPFRDQLKSVDTLVFVPDAAFRNVPMAALYDGQRYLVEDYAIALNPGLQLVNPKTTDTPLSAIGAGLIDVPKKYDLGTFPKTAVDQEFTSMQNAGILTQEPLLETKFTSAELARQLEKTPFNVVHLATHAGFSSRKDQTYVLMANGRVTVDEFSDILRKRTQQQPGSLELLVLSACETVTGDNRAALGLAGIAIRSGARSTLATLWTVQPKETADLIQSFYQQYVNRTTRMAKQTKAKALQAAQLKLKQTTDPSIWASYVLVGNWL